MKLNLKKIASLVGCAVLLAGCAQQQQQGKYTPAPAMVKSGSALGYFPSGRAEGSGLLLEKTAPAQVIAGQPYQYSYKVSNLTDATLENVIVTDRVSSNFTATDSTPKAASAADGIAKWNLGTFGPKESKTIVVNGSSPNEGVVTTCGWATYNPVVCQDIQVTKANISLTKSEPSDETICDPIPVTLTVKNTGSTPLTGVLIMDSLPSGMTSEGKSSLSFDAGSLAPGASKEFKYIAGASKAGKLASTAKVTSTQGVTAEASATTTVHQPVLAITCKADEQQFMGRRFDVCYTVSNKGDAAAAGTTLQVAIPAGLTVVSTTAGGVVTGNMIVWNLGTVAASASRDACVTFTSAMLGTFQFGGTATCACAAAVSSSCSSKVIGQAAILLEKADDPDPIAVGQTTTYTVRITNQGSTDDSNVQMVVTIAPELVPVSTTAGTISGNTVTMPIVAKLPAKAVLTYKIVAKGVKVGDGHTKFTLNSEVLKSSISSEESTHVY